MADDRNLQVTRILQVLSILEGSRFGLTIAELEDRLRDRGFSMVQRTVRRDVEALQAAGVSLIYDEAQSRYAIDPDVRKHGHIVVTPREILGLYLARESLRPLESSPLFRDLQGFFGKIEDKIGDANRAHLDELAAEIRFESTPQWGTSLEPELLDTLRSATAERHVLAMTYFSANSGTVGERRVGPHYLYFARGSLYLVAEDLADGVVKVFSVPRIKKATMTDSTYEGKITAPEEFFGHSFGVYRGDNPENICLVFAKELAPFVRERVWHHSQELRDLADGRLEFCAQTAVTPELVQWIMGFGAKATVLGPASLREKVLLEIEQMQRLYGSSTATTSREG